MTHLECESQAAKFFLPHAQQLLQAHVNLRLKFLQVLQANSESHELLVQHQWELELQNVAVVDGKTCV